MIDLSDWQEDHSSHSHLEIDCRKFWNIKIALHDVDGQSSQIAFVAVYSLDNGQWSCTLHSTNGYNEANNYLNLEIILFQKTQP